MWLQQWGKSIDMLSHTIKSAAGRKLCLSWAWLAGAESNVAANWHEYVCT